METENKVENNNTENLNEDLNKNTNKNTNKDLNIGDSEVNNNDNNNPNDTQKEEQGTYRNDDLQNEDNIKDKDQNKEKEALTEEQKETQRKLDEQTGVNTDVVSKSLQEAGITNQEVLDVLENNNGQLTLDMVKKLAKVHGETATGLLVEQLKSIHKELNVQKQALVQEVVNFTGELFGEEFKDRGDEILFGSEEGEGMLSWAKRSLPQEEIDVLNHNINKGGAHAKMAIKTLVDYFNANYSADDAPTELLEADDFGDSSITPITADAYHKELKRLRAEGEDYNTSPKIQALQKQRLKGISLENKGKTY